MQPISALPPLPPAPPQMEDFIFIVCKKTKFTFVKQVKRVMMFLAMVHYEIVISFLLYIIRFISYQRLEFFSTYHLSKGWRFGTHIKIKLDNNAHYFSLQLNSISGEKPTL